MSAQEARREKRARRKNLRLVDPQADAAETDIAPVSERAEPAPPREVSSTQKLVEAEMRRMSRETRLHPESSHRSERQARNATRGTETDSEQVLDEISFPENAEVAGSTEATSANAEAGDAAGKVARRRASTAEKARRRNSATLSEDNLLLIRQLSLTSQQLHAAHRVIGRLSAERDILRQHFADAVGIPVEEVIVATETNPAEAAQKNIQVEAKPPSRLEKLNYFGGNDYARMRRRRQTFVGILFAIILGLWMLSRAGFWSMPDNVSRDSLGQMPYIGDLMTYFLAGWLFFRVAKVSSKGVRWVFPAENKRRRR